MKIKLTSVYVNDQDKALRFHGGYWALPRAIRACSAFNNGYQPAAQTMWNTPTINAQIAAPYAAQGNPHSYIGIPSAVTR